MSAGARSRSTWPRRSTAFERASPFPPPTSLQDGVSRTPFLPTRSALLTPPQRSLEAQLSSLKTTVLSLDAGLILPIALMTLPVLLLPYYLYTRPSKNTYDPTTGIGRGAPGFQTGSSRVALPASIVARIRMGEEVGSEEITEALEEEERRRKEEEEERRRQREADERVRWPGSFSVEGA